MLRRDRVALATAPGWNAGVLLGAGTTICARAWLRPLLPLLAIAVVVTAAAVQGYAWFRAAVVQTNAVVSGLDVNRILFPVVHTHVLVEAAHEYAPWRTTEGEIESSSHLWRRMHLMHWNSVPERLRARALDRMLAQYHGELFDPQRWDRMTVEDWDRVPQPIRTLAYRHMLDFWSGYYQPGAAYDIPTRQIADVLAAIVMSESWFEHRAYFVNARGNQDLGLAQASDFARRRVRELYSRGTIDATFEDADYYNPWRATRFAALWLNLLLDEAKGDLDTAIAAYHRGIASAHDERGKEYLRMVRQRFTRYIRNTDAPVAWSYVWHRGRDLAQDSWPWLRLNVH
jgi:hypothetical protein